MDDLDILIVDDDLEFGKTLSDILIIEGYAPTAVATGKEGLSIVRGKTTYLALIDISLKDITGIDVLRGIKKISPDTECIMITGVASKETAIEAVNSGAFYYVQKPCDIKQLLLIIRRAVEKRKMDIMFRNSEERHRLFFKNTPIGIMYYNIEGIITDVNNFLISILGSTRERLIGLDINDNPDKNFAGEISKTLKGEKGHYEGLYRLFTGKKEAYIKADWIPITDGKRFLGGVGIIEDLTESKLLENQFRQAQKMEAVGQLTGGIAHDSNNLFSVIQGYTELSMIDTEKSNPLYFNLKQIRNSVIKAANLARQLLVFSRKQPGVDFSLLNLNIVIDDFFTMVHRIIGENITIKTYLEPEVLSIRGNMGNIEQLIVNLAVNARDAMPDGGLLTIKTENITLDKEYSRLVPYSRPGEFVRLSIEDTGTGMDAETMEHIFEPFFTTKEVGKGTGLGMSVVYGIARDHGGWINVYSELGSGTSFKIYFPVSSGISEGKIKEDFSVEDLQGKGERILLIEDEDKVRDIASTVLGNNGYVIFRAHNAKRAMDIFAEENGRFHLIFCDVVLPDENGIQLTDHLLSQNSDIKILMCSGYINDKSQRESLQKENIPFLQKPYSLPDLLQVVKDVLKGSSNNNLN